MVKIEIEIEINSNVSFLILRTKKIRSVNRLSRYF